MSKKNQNNHRIDRVFPIELIEAIKASKNILIATHISPDADTIGSAIALGLALELLEKNVTIACSDPVPEILYFMDKAKQIVSSEHIASDSFDLAIAVDVSDALRLGELSDRFFTSKITAQIDHHGTNPSYAHINYVDANAAATTVIILDLLEKLNVNISKDMANALYSGLIVDTGNFSFNNSNPEAFQVGGDLVAYGAEVDHINRILFREKSPEQVLLLAKALEHLTFFANGKIAGICLSKNDIKNISEKPEYTDGIVNYGIEITGVKISFFAKENQDGTKFSMRSLKPYDAAKIAKIFGGGGHPLAAGFTIEKSLMPAVKEVVSEIKKIYKFD